MLASYLLPLLAATAFAIDTISIKGSKFFTSSGSQFYIKGVAYQLTDSDPLADGDQCALDAALMKTLGANTIRVYHVDATADHDACMSAFSDAGIYVFLDLDTFSTYIITSPPSWTTAQYSAFSAVMDAFHSYDNVAGFFVGNEGIVDGATSDAAPYIKAAARDMKAYRDSKGYREIPVGYSAADIASLRPNLQNYLACGGNSSEALDFYSLNAYEWCGDSSFDVSGYSALETNAEDYNIPIFFSETGCNTVPPRTFTDQSAILGPDMDNTWSGAIIYEWIEETNNYGLISYGPPAATGATEGTTVIAGYTRQGTPTPISPDFSNLSNQWATLNPTGTSSAAYTPSLSAPACPSYTSGTWEVSGDVALPTLGQVAAASGSSGSSASSATTVSSLPSTSTSSTSASAKSTSSSTSLTSTPLTATSQTTTTGSGSASAGTASSSSKTGSAASSLRATSIVSDVWVKASIAGAALVMAFAVFL